MTITQPIVRDALPSDAPFLAQCILAGFHLYDFEPEGPIDKEVYRLLNECIKREDLLYTYKFARIAEVDGVAAGALLSYPGELYRGLRHKTFVELWPDLLRLDAESEQETGPQLGSGIRASAACSSRTASEKGSAWDTSRWDWWPMSPCLTLSGFTNPMALFPNSVARSWA